VTLYQYNQLTEDEQANTVYQQGVLISLRYSARHRILLYQVGPFYVEIYYNPRKSCIDQFKSFDNLELLAPYLEKINLEGIL
jgi:hypothetical protein